MAQIYHGSVLIVNIFPFDNFIDLMQCVFNRDFVRELGREPATIEGEA